MKNPSIGIHDPPASRMDHLSHLPFEIHLLILQKLHYVEFTRFSAVCKAWRSIASAARQSPLFRLQQVPWPIYTRELCKLFGLQDSSCSIICGSASSQDWLLLRHSSTPFNNGESFVLNPLTRQRISLPKTPIGNILEVGVILPQSTDGITVVAYFRDDSVYPYFRNDSFYQWRSQDKHWTYIGGDGSGRPSISDMIYHKGNIYAVNNYNINDIFIINISSGRPNCRLKTLPPFLDDELRPKYFKHLVECDGDLLMVVASCLPCKRSHRNYKNKATLKVRIFKYNLIHGWEKVESIGEKYALLVGKGNNIAIDVSTNTSFRANCVYFLADQRIRGFNLGNNLYVRCDL